MIIVQLIIFVNNEYTREDGTTYTHADTRRSAPMPIEYLFKKYGRWMSTHKNWQVRPVEQHYDF